LEILKVSSRCGFMSLWLQTRWTVLLLTLASRAIERTLVESGAPSPEHSRNKVIVTLLRDSTLEPGVRLKTVKPKSQADQPTEYWSPNYLGRVFRAETENGDPEKSPTPTLEKRSLEIASARPTIISAQNHLDPTIPDWQPGRRKRGATRAEVSKKPPGRQRADPQEHFYLLSSAREGCGFFRVAGFRPAAYGRSPAKACATLGIERSDRRPPDLRGFGWTHHIAPAELGS
jgi:hypothetical protein